MTSMIIAIVATFIIFYIIGMFIPKDTPYIVYILIATLAFCILYETGSFKWLYSKIIGG